MANSTNEYWAVDGVSLQTFAYNISTWGGARQSIPGFRGSDIVVPARTGQIWQPKVVDSRVITLEMWVIGADSDGNNPSDKTQRQQFEQNWTMLRNLLWAPGRQMVLTKRFYPPGSSTLTTATALAEFAGGLVPMVQGRGRAMFSVDLKLAHPFFVGDPVTTSFPSATRSKVVNLAGDYMTNDISLEFNGALTTPKVTVSNVGNVTLAGAYSVGDKATMDVNDWRVYVDVSSGTDYYASGRVTSTLKDKWLALNLGNNTVTVSAASGTGTVNMIHRPQWL